MKNYIAKYKGGIMSDTVIQANDENEAYKAAVAEARFHCGACSRMDPEDVVVSVEETDEPVSGTVRARVTVDGYEPAKAKDVIANIMN